MSSAARRAVEHVAARSAGKPVDAALRVTLNFHPDRGEPSILESLASAGVYRSQFVTGTSNGGLTAYPGGDRWRWESRIFGGAYDDAAPEERPVYGALNFRGSVVGAAPRFGSAYFVLGAESLGRATFCYPDSFREPEDFGVAAAMDLIRVALADSTADALDDYIEAQVHGPVRLDADVEALVLDPCYQGTEVEELAGKLPCRVQWHPGFRAEPGGDGALSGLPWAGDHRAGPADRATRPADPARDRQSRGDREARSAGAQAGVALPGAFRGTAAVISLSRAQLGSPLR